jgi:hypothetical protein
VSDIVLTGEQLFPTDEQLTQEMRLSKLIAKLQAIYQEHGDLPTGWIEYEFGMLVDWNPQVVTSTAKFGTGRGPSHTVVNLNGPWDE